MLLVAKLTFQDVIPTGGDAISLLMRISPRALNQRCHLTVEDSRFGEIPKPTVIVRIKEKVS